MSGKNDKKLTSTTTQMHAVPESSNNGVSGEYQINNQVTSKSWFPINMNDWIFLFRRETINYRFQTSTIIV